MSADVHSIHAIPESDLGPMRPTVVTRNPKQLGIARCEWCGTRSVAAASVPCCSDRRDELRRAASRTRIDHLEEAA